MAKRHFPNALGMSKTKLQKFQTNWLMDPSCYPLIVIMGCAATFATGVGLSCLARNPDVRISKGDPMRRNGKSQYIAALQLSDFTHDNSNIVIPV